MLTQTLVQVEFTWTLEQLRKSSGNGGRSMNEVRTIVAACLFLGPMFVDNSAGLAEDNAARQKQLAEPHLDSGYFPNPLTIVGQDDELLTRRIRVVPADITDKVHGLVEFDSSIADFDAFGDPSVREAGTNERLRVSFHALDGVPGMYELQFEDAAAKRLQKRFHLVTISDPPLLIIRREGDSEPLTARINELDPVSYSFLHMIPLERVPRAAPPVADADAEPFFEAAFRLRTPYFRSKPNSDNPLGPEGYIEIRRTSDGSTTVTYDMNLTSFDVRGRAVMSTAMAFFPQPMELIELPVEDRTNQNRRVFEGSWRMDKRDLIDRRLPTYELRLVLARDSAGPHRLVVFDREERKALHVLPLFDPKRKVRNERQQQLSQASEQERLAVDAIHAALGGIANAEESFRFAIDSNRIDSVEMNGERISDEILSQIEGFNHLTKFELGDAPNVSPSALDVLSKLTKLRRVFIRENVAVDDDVLDSLGKLPELGFLRIDNGRGQSGSGISDLGITALQNGGQLNHVLIQRSTISDESIPTMQEWKSLRSLSLTNSNVTLAGALQLSKAIPEATITVSEGEINGSKRSVNLHGQRLSDAALETIAANFGEVEIIRAHHGEVSDEGLHQIKLLQSLREFSFQQCHGFTDAGLEAFEDLPKLETLSLFNCKCVTDASLIHLEKLLTLKSLNVSSTNMTDEGKAELRAKLSNCEVR